MGTKYTELKLNEEYEALYGSPLTLRVNTLLWRSYDTRYEAIPERYTYYGNYRIAKKYDSLEHRKLGCFVTTREIKLMDVRFMMNILERMIQIYKNDKYINDFAPIMLSFGLCSLIHQINVLRMRYSTAPEDSEVMKGIKRMNELYNADKPNNIIEHKGIRVGETTNDGITMGFLQELFKGHFDGFIAPPFRSVFHSQGFIDGEIVIFNPKRSDIKQINMEKIIKEDIQVVKVSDLMKLKYKLIEMDYKKGIPISIKYFVQTLQKGGRKKHIHHINIIEDKLNNNDREAIENHNKAIKAGKRWNRKMMIWDMVPPREELEVVPFTTNTISDFGKEGLI